MSYWCPSCCTKHWNLFVCLSLSFNPQADCHAADWQRHVLTRNNIFFIPAALKTWYAPLRKDFTEEAEGEKAGIWLSKHLVSFFFFLFWSHLMREGNSTWGSEFPSCLRGLPLMPPNHPFTLSVLHCPSALPASSLLLLLLLSGDSTWLPVLSENPC